MRENAVALDCDPPGTRRPLSRPLSEVTNDPVDVDADEVPATAPL
jgi:hypothetical protein